MELPIRTEIIGRARPREFANADRPLNPRKRRSCWPVDRASSAHSSYAPGPILRDRRVGGDRYVDAAGAARLPEA
jgi:hypothetical protein